jgi:ADP-ribosylation factor related protein 1
MLEKVKTIFSPSQPGLSPSQITPTIGQNIGRITLSSIYLKFWDLGGLKDIRRIWEKYCEEADAICWVLDSQDRFWNGWKSDSHHGQSSYQVPGQRIGRSRLKDEGEGQIHKNYSCDTQKPVNALGYRPRSESLSSLKYLLTE